MNDVTLREAPLRFTSNLGEGDEARKAEVVGNARSDAVRRNLPADRLMQIWEDLVETSIAYELVEWDRLREGN